METLCLAGNGRVTTRLGFGGSSLMGLSLDRARSLAVLEAAWDAGIRHFDVAPMYGYGDAEACVGEFLAGHPDATVTTKFGMESRPRPGVLGIAKLAAGKVLGRVPGFGGGGVGAAKSAEANGSRFRGELARASLERSLRLLRRERIDLWLMHEAEAGDLSEELLRFCEDAVAGGRIGAFGVGSEAQRVAGVIERHPAFARVVQCEWSVQDAPVTWPQETFRLHHRSLTNHFRELHAALVASPERLRAWSAATGVDLSDGERLAELMLKASLELNPGSVVLFSSKNPKHIAQNVAVAQNEGLAEPARELYRLVQDDAESRRVQVA